MMKKVSASALLLLFLFTAPSLAETPVWPRLSKDKDGKFCEKALKIAEGVFSSSAFYIFAPLLCQMPLARS